MRKERLAAPAPGRTREPEFRLRWSLLLVAILAVAGMIAWYILSQPRMMRQMRADLGFGSGLARPVSIGRAPLPALRAGEPPVSRCDQLAADPWDPGKRAAGHPIQAIDAAGAITACRAAIETWPGVARFELQLARAYLAAGLLDDATAWLEKAAGNNSAAANYELGYAHLAGFGGRAKDPKKAVAFYTRAAKGGHPAAQTALGVLHAKGIGVDRHPATAMEWFRRAAKAGYPSAQNNLGEMYYRGEGARRDYVKAAHWVRKAAEQGHPGAQYNLGYLYRFGTGVETDEARAVHWFQAAAERGVAKAMSHLAGMYRDGRGVKKDPSEAYFWFALSAGQGLGSAAAKRDQVGALITATERKAQLRRIALWEPKLNR